MSLFFFAVRRQFKNSRRLGEPMEYIFDDSLNITGESFDTKMTWEKIYKVSTTKHLLLIWQTENLANFIPAEICKKSTLERLRKFLPGIMCPITCKSFCLNLLIIAGLRFRKKYHLPGR